MTAGKRILAGKPAAHWWLGTGRVARPGDTFDLMRPCGIAIVAITLSGCATPEQVARTPEPEILIAQLQRMPVKQRIARPARAIVPEGVRFPARYPGGSKRHRDFARDAACRGRASGGSGALRDGGYGLRAMTTNWTRRAPLAPGSRLGMIRPLVGAVARPASRHRVSLGHNGDITVGCTNCGRRTLTHPLNPGCAQRTLPLRAAVLGQPAARLSRNGFSARRFA